MADRSTFSGASAPMPTGIEFLDQYADRMSQLFNNSVLPLHSVGGTGDAVTASVDPPLTAGLVAGMKFTVAWAGANSGAMTLAIGGGTALPVLDADGADMAAFAAAPGRRALLEYVGGAFVVLGGGGDSGGPPPYYEVITTSGTWTKPAGFGPDSMVMVEAWGGGGGGSRQSNSSTGTTSAGGGGGGYSFGRFLYGNLPADIAVSVGAGGSGRTGSIGSGTAGGNSTFGAFLLALGGGGGLNSGNGGPAGSGGGAYGEVGLGSGIGPSGNAISPGNPATHDYAGGSGGKGSTGGRSVVGGGGGGANSSNGGVSTIGGSGGAGGQPGDVPGGGGGGGVGNGGNGGAGARGEVRIWIIG